MASGRSPDSEPDTEEEVNWREDLDRKLHRLHSLLFGADNAMERGDPSAARVLAVRLLGFLDSQSKSSSDASIIHPIRGEVLSKIDAYRRALSPLSDRHAFECARRKEGNVFTKKGDINMEKIWNSKYFKPYSYKQKLINTLVLNSSENLESSSHNSNILRAKALLRSGHPDDENHIQSCPTISKSAKVLSQAKLTYGGKILKPSMSSYKKQIMSDSGNGSNHGLFDVTDPSIQHLGSSKESSPFFAENAEALNDNLRTKRRNLMSMHERKSPPNGGDMNDDSSVDHSFVTAKMKLVIDSKQRRGLMHSPSSSPSLTHQSDGMYRNTMRTPGTRPVVIPRRGMRTNFVPPVISNEDTGGATNSRMPWKSNDALEDSTTRCLEMLCGPDGELPEKLRNLEPRLIEHVSNEIMDRDPNVRWDDIAGLEHAKKCVTEMVIWPLLRPDIFQGCRSPGRGLLLFGPPGTGKTMIGKAIAGEAKATFFYISASSLTSKWIGEGEKLVRALFAVATCRQPAVIFVDEIDSLLSQRKSEGEHESSRRLKTQFLIEMEGFDSGTEQILLVGATNRPQELDEAARRRLTKRLYIPLPCSDARAWIVRNLLAKDGLFCLSEEDITYICNITQGYSGSDMKNLVKDASMGPLREALREGVEITKLKKDEMRPVTLQDFEKALQEVRPSVSGNELYTYEEWNKQFGSLSI